MGAESKHKAKVRIGCLDFGAEPHGVLHVINSQKVLFLLPYRKTSEKGGLENAKID